MYLIYLGPFSKANICWDPKIIHVFMTLFIVFNNLRGKAFRIRVSCKSQTVLFSWLEWLLQSGLAGVRELDHLQEHLGAQTLTCVGTA